MLIIPSPQQEAVLTAVRTTSDNLLVSACAGGAKTTTLVMASKAVGPGRSQLFLAFNKSVAETLRTRLPYFCRAETFNAFAFGVLRNFLGKSPKVDARAADSVFKALCPNTGLRIELKDSVLPLVSLAKSAGLEPGDDEALSALAEDNDLDLAGLSFADAILDRMSKPPFDVIDFDDQLWLPYVLGIRFPVIHNIFLDEAQDTNPVQQELLARIPNARILAVGDSHQAIYAFRGADANAMESLRERFNMTELPLSVSYRCSKSVVREAQKYL